MYAKQKIKAVVTDIIFIFGFLVIYPMIFLWMSEKSLFSGKVTTSLSLEYFINTRLGLDTFFYISAVIFFHLLLVAFIRYISSSSLKNTSFSFRTRRWLELFICLCVIWWVYMANGLFYPRSIHADVIKIYYKMNIQWALFFIVSIILTGVFFIAFFRTVSSVREKYIKFFKSFWVTVPYKSLLKYSLMIIVIICMVLMHGEWESLKKQSNPSLSEKKKTNVIIIGIDSLRPDILGTQNISDKSYTPNLDRFLKKSKLFETAYTPHARTYPAWNSILTGVYPMKHGVRFNLMNQKNRNREINSIAKLFGEKGFYTFYASDEKRFSNIDESYGFQKVIGPKTGAGDFFLGELNDLPLTNLISNMWLGQMFFPFSYGNRAAAKTYKPGTFDRMIIRELDQENEKPLFLCVHFCLPHWPYLWSETLNGVPDNLDTFSQYKKSLQQVDKQFESLICFLEKKRILKNALVIVLSDHGESFVHDSVQYTTGVNTRMKKVKRVAVPGHGTDVLNRKQYEVLLAFRGFGKFNFAPGKIKQHASLIDIAPTILDFYDGQINSQFEGISLRPWIERKDVSSIPRFFYVETGFSVPAIIISNSPNMVKVFEQGARHYTVSKEGRVVIKDESIPLLMGEKQYALYADNLTFSVFPDGGLYKHSRYALVDHKTNMWYTSESSFFKKHLDLYDKLQRQFGTDHSFRQMDSHQKSN